MPETLDKAYLEYASLTTARNGREIDAAFKADTIMNICQRINDNLGNYSETQLNDAIDRIYNLARSTYEDIKGKHYWHEEETHS